MRPFRHILSILGVLVCAMNGYAQTEKNDQGEKDKNPNPWFTPEQSEQDRDRSMVDVTFAPAEVKMIPAPPAAAQATKYADVPVTYGLGLVDVTIPLYTVQSRTLSLPIYLSYDSGGVRVEDVSGPVGLGWTLEAGGVITRTVNGYADEDIGGWDVRPPDDPTSPYFNNAEYLKKASKGEYDLQADMFSFNFCGYKGSFYWDRNTYSYVPTSATDLKIMGGTNSFLIIDTDGTQYFFTETEVSGRTLTYTLPYYGSGGCSLPGTMAPVTAWYLTKIVAMGGTDEIDLEYVTDGSFGTSHHTDMRSYQFTYRYHVNGYYSWMGANGVWGTAVPAVSTLNGAYVVKSTFTPHYLKSISYAGGTVTFSYKNNPVPHIAGEPRRSYPRLLSCFRVNPKSSISTDTTTIRRCVFTQKSTQDARNLLENVVIYGGGSPSVINDSYAFTYINESTNMLMYSRDLFGYYNGSSNYGTAFLRLFNDNGTFSETIANRNYDSYYASCLSLETITTAAGAKTKFFYEGNSISTGGASSLFSDIGIGIRISHIVTYDLSQGSETAVRERWFSYSSPGITIPFSAFSHQSFLSVGEQFREDLTQGLGTIWWGDTGSNVFGVPRTVTVAFSDQSVLPGVPLEAARIYYGAVTERVKDANSSASVRTDYLFNSSGTVHDISGGTLPSSMAMVNHDDSCNTQGLHSYHFYQRMPSLVPRVADPPSVSIVPVWSHYVPEDFPQITAPATIKRYKSANGNEVLISQTDNVYAKETSSFYMAFQARNLIVPGVETHMANINHFNDYYWACINHKRIWYRLIQTTETEWLDDGNSHSSVTTYSYIPPSNAVPASGAILTPLSTATVIDQDPERTYVRSYTYSTQLTSSITWADSLANLRYHRPIAETLYGGSSGSAFSQTRAETWALTSPPDGASVSFMRPKSISFSRKNPGESQGTTVWTVHYDKYDQWGNPLQISENGQPTRTYLWGYNGLRPVMEVLGDGYDNVKTAVGAYNVNAIASGAPTECQMTTARNSLESGSNYSRQVSWYLYNRHLKGITIASDVSGRKTQYTYDYADRLTFVDDEDGNHVQANIYNLTAGSGGSPNSIASAIFPNSGSLPFNLIQDYTYYDGLGRTLQVVNVGASIASKDLITPFTPDFLDREDARVYVPFPDMITSSAAGSYRSNALYYQQISYGAKGFTENTYELSSRNRVVASSLPGFMEATTSTTANSAANTVLKLSYNRSSNTLSASGYYSSGRFIVTITEGPDGSRTESYTDEFGTPVLERVKLDASGTMADTYYVKDAIGHVLCVVPPDQSVQLSSSTSGFSAANCYTYAYDGRDRVVSRQLPAQPAETIVYNGADMPTSRTRLASDGQANEVFATQYDGFNRPVQETYQYGNNTAVTLAEYAYDSYPSWSPAFAAETGYVGVSDLDSRTRGLQTAERVTLLPGSVAPSALTSSNTSAKTSRAFYYDAKANVRQVARSEANGGTVYTSSTYGFTGNLLSERQRITPATGQSAHTLDRTYTYDSRLRPASLTASLDGGSAATETYTYSARGPLARIIRGGGTETTIFGYTLQDWQSSTTSTSWADTLRYASPSRSATDVLPGKSGLITEWTSWQKGTSADGGVTASQTYAFSYDKAGRLTGSTRYDGNSNTANNTLTERDITYDRSGNLLTLNRYGDSSATTPAEALSFSYSGPKRSGWTYDSHGNVTADPTGSMSLAWNAIGLPRAITGSGSASIQRSYLADGSLAQVSDGSTTRMYLGNMVFTQSGGTFTLKSAAWDGGLLLPGSGADKVLYYVKDHLGSTRVVKDGAGNIRQRYDYYPYGSVSRTWSSSTSESPDKRYRFGGKEVTGAALSALSASSVPYLDFGARLYTPGTAMWLSQDPMAEDYYRMTPYLYCAGSPGNVVDPEGRDIWTINRNGDIVWKETSDEHYLYYEDDAGNRTDKFIKINDASILIDLENPSGAALVNGKNVTVFKSKGKETSEIFKIFTFAADLSNVEWVIHKNGDNYTLGTIHDKNSSAGFADYGLSLPEASVHSHPDRGPVVLDEKESMGYWHNLGQWIYTGDAYNVRHAKRNTNNYVYFPISRRLYYLGENRPSYIRTINDYKSFFFGTLNNR